MHKKKFTVSLHKCQIAYYLKVFTLFETCCLTKTCCLIKKINKG